MRVTWNDLLRPGDASEFFVRDPLPAFDPTAREYSPANAWWLAELSRIVYRRDRPETHAPLEPSRSEFTRRVGLEEIGFARSDEAGSAHCSLRPEWSAPLRSNIQKFLKKTGNDPGVVRPAASAIL